jgi:hypothetical protein
MGSVNTNPGSILTDTSPPNLQTSVLGESPNRFIPGPCNQNAQNQNQLPSATVLVTLPPGEFAVFDQLVTLPTPCKRIMLTSFSEIQEYGTPSQFYSGPPPADILNGVWLALSKTGYPPFTGNSGGNTFQNEGTENWLPLFSGGSNSDEPSCLEGMIIEFAQPVTQFFLNVACKNTSNIYFNFTFACADSVPRIFWKSQS